MRKFISALCLVSLVAVGCASATVEDDVCSTNAIQLPNVPLAGVVVPTVSAFTTMNVSDTIKKLSDIGDVSISVNSNTLTNASGDFSWANHLEVDIVSTKDPATYPQVMMTSIDLTAAERSSSSINLPISMDNTAFFNYLKQGEVELTFIVSGSVPQQPVNASDTLCLHASVSVDKSL
jgi:hypothetical protein